MAKSDQIKLEIDRLTSEESKIRVTLQEKMTLAASHFKKTKDCISQFLQREKAETEHTKLQKIAEARAVFVKQHENLRAAIQAKTGLTYAAWETPLWSSFDIVKERADQNLTRLGSFLVKGQNEQLRLPAMFPIFGRKNVLLRAEGTGRSKARGILRNIALRLLASLPPGKLRFTFIDPVELGSTAAGLLGALPDFLTGGIAWHEEQDIQDQLSLIETRIAAIKTKYLGIKFSSIEEYNAHAGTIEEPYWLIVVSDCPIRFREAALQKLVSIAKNGPQAGVYLAVMLDDGEKKCTDALISDIAVTASHIVCPDNGAPVFFDDTDFRDLALELDAQPSSGSIERIAKQVSRTAANAKIVKIPWEAPAPENWWKEDSRAGIKIPIGIYGARQTQFFEIDEKLLHGALIIGKPGVGKSKLLHVLINGMTTRYSPRDLTLYLLDCKQVEFKDYATHKLPHARVVAIESEREFGLSVLRHLNAELDFRKTEFSSAGETSLSNYRNKTGKPMPRIVLIIDEFQELLNSDDALAREAANILDRLVRLGRALGINVILASQTLAGQTTLQASTRNQIPIRIILQCSESDSVLALSQDNNEARLLERPGEAIYNSANGRREGNNRFQVTWLSDEALESLLTQVSAHAAKQEFSATVPQVIFDGNSMADIRQNNRIAGILRKEIPFNGKGGVFAYLGEPIEMKDPTAAIFKRQSRSNLLVLGQNEYEQSCVSMLMAAVASIAIQQPPEAARFIILNLADQSAEWSQLPEIFKNSFPHQVELTTKAGFNEKLSDLVALIDRDAAVAAPTHDASIYLVILGLHRERNLRKVDGGFKISKADAAKPLASADLLSKICRESPTYGIHCLIWCDTFSNFDRVFQRNDLEEFSLRAGLQMSESDSRSFLDSDDASRLGSHRAIFFDDEKNGRLEKFRPYSPLSAGWLEEVAGQLAK